MNHVEVFRSILLAAVFAATAAPCNAGGKITVGWSVWTGWMPFKVMEKEGFLAKRAKQHGVEIELKEFKEYMPSVTAFATKKIDACAMTCMEALQPASSGVRTVAVVANDTSNGGDGVVMRKGKTIKDIKGLTVQLEEKSVSHYLLSRALAENGMVDSDVKIRNLPGDEAGKAFLTDKTVDAVATWNPHLFNAQESGQGTVAFDSSKIPGEIVDLIVFNAETVEKNPDAVRALTEAWYDAVAMMDDKAERERAVATMADGAGSTPKEFEKMLAGTILYTKPEQTASLFNGPKMKSTMAKVKKFSAAQGLITDADFEVGYGPGSKALLSFDPTFAEGVQSGAKAKPSTPAAGKP